MERYRNLDGNSGVVSYEIGADFIKVKFHDGPPYVYDNTTPGAIHVDRMKALARAGRGLSTYISKHVRDSYARKEG